ncbi:MAG: reverse transcriptase-like protein [Armatimonadota bacterium]
MVAEPGGRESRYVYALTSATARLAVGMAGIAVILKDARKNVLRRVRSRISCTSQEGAVYEAILTALREAKALGARNVTVYCDDPAVVGHLNRDLEVPPGLTQAFIQVRALMNRFRKANVQLIEDDKNTRARRMSELALESGEDEARAYESPGLPLNFE